MLRNGGMLGFASDLNAYYESNLVHAYAGSACDFDVIVLDGKSQHP